MVNEVNKQKNAFKGQHYDATEDEIMESERDLSHSSNSSTSCSRPPRVDEQQLQEVQERYEQRLKESEERAQQQIQEVQQRALRTESLCSTVQSQVAAIFEHQGMPAPPPPPQVFPQNNDDRGDNIGLDENVN
ncbi:hypothetical protein ACLB2K_049738 [Fragaria x ananassa]